MKSEIVERLGQGDVLLPALIAEGLRANDRVKARLSVLQAAARHARRPQDGFNLEMECRAAGLDGLAMEALVNHADAVGADTFSAPGLAGLGRDILDDVQAMVRAVAAGLPADGEHAAQRLSTIRAEAPLGDGERMPLARVARLTGVAGSEGESLHRLVMDLHKSLNQLSAQHAEEVLDGAHVYGLEEGDRAVVGAFMAGLNATRSLKFDHPGLGTIAARSGGRLTIQNDIGETDAHVVVVAIEDGVLTLTYTDVHLVRARFFIGLLRDHPFAWSGLDRQRADGIGEEDVFYLVTGRCDVTDPKVRDAALEAVGAALVFLIDWNKARKVLRAWVSKADAVHVLDWAARNRCGHRAFLELGGSELVAAAVHHATPTRIGFGERLDGVLGREAAIAFLKAVLRISADALLQGSSVRLARDRIEAELMRHLQRVEAELLAVVVRQAGLAREIAARVAGMLAELAAGRPARRDALARSARAMEEKADRIALDARNKIARFAADPAIERLVNQMEDAIDELEQAAFVASLTPDGLTRTLTGPLRVLADAALQGASAASAGAAAAADVPEGQRVDSEDALAAAGRLLELEHAADDAERTLTACLLRGDFDVRTALSVLELARALERATDRLAGFGHLLRGHVLADLAN